MKQKIIKIINSKSRRFTVYCFAFLVSVAIASVLDLRKVDWLIYFMVGMFGILFFTKQKYIKFGILLVIVFGLGVVRYSLVFPVSDVGRIESLVDQKITVNGFISSEPDVRLDSVRYVITAQNIEARAGPGLVSGNFLVVVPRYPRFDYGDILQIQCQIKKPEPIIDEASGKVFRYDLALARQNIFAICQSPFISKIGVGEGNIVMQKILQFKNILATRLEKLWPEPYASFMAGLLYGYRGGLGPLNDLFSKTGVAHIVAVSGFNISIIATLLLSTCYCLAIKRRQAFWVVAICIFTFVIFTGASASVVRAGIMGFIALLAKQVGRGSKIGPVLLLTAVIMAIQNPLVLLYDAGFQLSFLATMGLVYVNPLIKPYLDWIPDKFGLQENTISTTAATLATLPLILYQFGRLALLTVIVNVLVLWVIPLLMAVGFAAVLASIIHIYAGIALAWIGWLGMWYVITVVTWFGNLTWASPEVNFSLPLTMISYFFLFFWVHKNQVKYVE